MLIKTLFILDFDLLHIKEYMNTNRIKMKSRVKLVVHSRQWDLYKDKNGIIKWREKCHASTITYVIQNIFPRIRNSDLEFMTFILSLRTISIIYLLLLMFNILHHGFFIIKFKDFFKLRKSFENPLQLVKIISCCMVVSFLSNH